MEGHGRSALLVESVLRARWQSMGTRARSRPSVAIDGHRQPSMAIDSHRWPSTAIDGHRRPSTAIDSHPWQSMAIHGHGNPWQSTALHAHQCLRELLGQRAGRHPEAVEVRRPRLLHHEDNAARREAARQAATAQSSTRRRDRLRHALGNRRLVGIQSLRTACGLT